MDDDTTRKINDIKIPTDDGADIEDYENSIMEIKKQSVSFNS